MVYNCTCSSFCIQILMVLFHATHAGILACGIHSTKEGGITDHITEAANAAITVIETFSGIFLPGLTKKHPSVRLGLHTG